MTLFCFVSAPIASKPSELVTSNTTAIKLNIYTWRDGGCPISKLNVEYRAVGESHWTIAADGALTDNLILGQLTAAQWYQLKIAVTNDAGTTAAELNVDTLKENGGK